MNIATRWSQLGAYLLIVTFGVVGFFIQSSNTDKINSIINERGKLRNEQANNQCLDSQKTREGLRDSITGIASIGRQLVVINESPNSAQVLKSLNDYEQSQLQAYPVIECPVIPNPSVSEK